MGRHTAVILWRISNHASLDGIGGLHASGRWHSRGRRIVYFATSPAGALIEHLVHLELPAELLPSHYLLMKVEVLGEPAIETIAESTLPAGWMRSIETSRTIGDQWLTEGRSALLSVPSAIVPETENILYNPAIGGAYPMHVRWHRPFMLDRRLLKAIGGQADRQE